MSQRQLERSGSRVRETIQKTLDLYEKQFQPGYNRLNDQKRQAASVSPMKKVYHRGIYPTWCDYIDGIYQGAMDLERNPDGPGIFMSDSGYFYIGEWDRGLLQGKGFLVAQSGTFFYGSFRLGKVNGYGIQTLTKGVILIGYFNSGRVSGKGWIYNDHLWCEAEFEQGKVFKYIKEEIVSKDFDLPIKIEMPKVVQELIRDINGSAMLKKLEQFQIDTQKSCYSKIKCLRLEPKCLYLGFILNDSTDLTGLGTVIKDMSVPFYGHLQEAKLNGYGRFFLPDDAYYVGHFKQGKFSGIGCLVQNEKVWQAGRWNGQDFVVPDVNSGQGQASTWIHEYLKDIHLKSKKHVSKKLIIEKGINNFFHIHISASGKLTNAPAEEGSTDYSTYILDKLQSLKPRAVTPIKLEPPRTLGVRTSISSTVKSDSSRSQSPPPPPPLQDLASKGKSYVQQKKEREEQDQLQRSLEKAQSESKDQKIEELHTTPLFSPHKKDPPQVISPMNAQKNSMDEQKQVFTPLKSLFEKPDLNLSRSRPPTGRKRIFQPLERSESKYLFSQSEYNFLFQK